MELKAIRDTVGETGETVLFSVSTFNYKFYSTFGNLYS